MNQAVVQNRVVVRGAGELASGAIKHLIESGFEVIALERPDPLFVRRYVCFGEAYFKQETTVEGITAVLVKSAEEATTAASDGLVPIMIDPAAGRLAELAPLAVVDGRMLKQDIDTTVRMAPVVVGLGPGFIAGHNCHAAVETNRGDSLGKVYYKGHPQPDTGVPSAVNGFGRQRVLRSPADGKFVSLCSITDAVTTGQVVAKVGSAAVVSELDGMVRGLIHDGLRVSAGQKVGDIDPRCVRENCFKMSDKAHAVGRGVVEALSVLSKQITYY